MGLTPNVVSNTPIASVWGNEIRDRSVQNFATAAERASQWPTPPEGALSYQRDTDTLVVWNGAAWVCITPITNSNPATSTRTATTYGDLVAAPAGPQVTILTGTKALVTITANINNSGGTAQVNMGYDISGATSRAANDLESLQMAGSVGAQQQSSFVHLATGLTPGLNTFTAKYRAQSATITALARHLTVVGVP